MEVIQKKIEELKFAEYNPRNLTEQQYSDLKMSLKEFGFAEPIIINKHKGRENIIIGGHQRVRVAKDIGIKEIPCVEVDLPLAREKELNIRLNKNIGQWDWDLLANNFDKDDLLNWGFDDADFGDVDLEGWNPPKTEEAEIGDGINELIGYGLQSFWKDLNRNNSELADAIIELPVQNDTNLVRQKYNRTNLEEIRRIVKTYMRKGDYFLENCCGWSTFSCTAVIFGYNGVGIDIWNKAIDHGKQQYNAVKKFYKDAGEYKLIKGDGMKLEYPDETFDYVYCNPPFMDEEKYSGLDNDIADSDFGKFAGKFIKLISENYRVLKQNGLCTITINDKREKSFLIPIQKNVIEWGEKAGFKLWDFVIAEVNSQKIRLRKKDYELKRTVKCHEYVITFIK